ncbi:hypothetical protein U9M48_012169 [Paspalum notatum var. saurae]|uniref:Shugoshin C-terminal domain-containing protein n=1 Tax=Paspalum notatum var. saurae TaxID=547442 RepID=A0AAQ3WIA3_PASNO
MASAAARGAAQGGFNTRANPSGDGGPKLRSSPAKGGKPVALADITNTGRPNAPRSIGLPDVVKENAKLLHVLTEKTKVIELSRIELQKLHLALQASRRQNLQLVQTNSQMLAELNSAKDRIKILQHELACTTALLKVKDSEARQETNVQVEPPQDATKKRGRNKLKSGSSECIKDINKIQDSYKPQLDPIMSLDHEDLRRPQRRKSSRLNKGSCEISGVCKTLNADTVAPFALSSSSVLKQHEPTAEKDMSMRNECSAIVHEVVLPSEIEEIDINVQQQQEVSLKQSQEACSRVTGVEAHKTGDKACNAKQNHVSEAAVSFDIIEVLKPPADNSNKRDSNKQKLALCESASYSAIEDVTTKHDTTTSDPLCLRKRRKSARLNPISSEDTETASEALCEDVIAPLAGFSLNDSTEQMTTQKKSDSCLSRKSTEVNVAGRRSLRRAAEKVVSYKEIPLNIKMRRP